MNQILTVEKKQRIIRRAVDGLSSANGDAYVDALEDALVKALTQLTGQRKELRRLNQQVRYMNSIVAHNDKLSEDVETLVEILDREEAENADTDPTQLEPEVETEEDNFPTQLVSSNNESYEAWDIKTRFPNLKPREVRSQ